MADDAVYDNFEPSKYGMRVDASFFFRIKRTPEFVQTLILFTSHCHSYSSWHPASVCQEMTPYGIAGDPAALSTETFVQGGDCGSNMVITEASYQCEEIEFERERLKSRHAMYFEDHDLDLGSLHQKSRGQDMGF